MKTNNTNNRTQKTIETFALIIATIYSIATVLGVGYILLNIDKVSFNFQQYEDNRQTNKKSGASTFVHHSAIFSPSHYINTIKQNKDENRIHKRR